jgi:hypothetical protein
MEREEQPLHVDDDHAVEEELAGYLAPFVAMLPSPYREALTLVELEGGRGHVAPLRLQSEHGASLELRDARRR